MENALGDSLEPVTASLEGGLKQTKAEIVAEVTTKVEDVLEAAIQETSETELDLEPVTAVVEGIWEQAKAAIVEEVTAQMDGKLAAQMQQWEAQTQQKDALLNTVLEEVRSLPALIEELTAVSYVEIEEEDDDEDDDGEEGAEAIADDVEEVVEDVIENVEEIEGGGDGLDGIAAAIAQESGSQADDRGSTGADDQSIDRLAAFLEQF